ncbi:MAG TPA: hypothetical protein VHY32_02740 [Caulobacteraceae bacterium]|jgi:hypothetical protein|nr:hypothetical protein [Caulobacteraceae bacterium]
MTIPTPSFTSAQVASELGITGAWTSGQIATDCRFSGTWSSSSLAGLTKAAQGATVFSSSASSWSYTWTAADGLYMTITLAGGDGGDYNPGGEIGDTNGGGGGTCISKYAIAVGTVITGTCGAGGTAGGVAGTASTASCSTLGMSLNAGGGASGKSGGAGGSASGANVANDTGLSQVGGEAGGFVSIVSTYS